MQKNAASKAVESARRVVPVTDRKVDFSQFKPDVSLKDLQKLLGGKEVVFGASIATLSPATPHGRGGTSLILEMPIVVQYTGTPYVSFDQQLTPVPPANGRPTLLIYFEPFAYGITWVANYLFEFSIATAGAVTLDVWGDAGPSATVLNGGSRVVNGSTILTVVLQNVPPNQPIYVSLEQTEGGFWEWFSTVVRFPPLVVGASA
jgi:hypothetical protein